MEREYNAPEGVFGFVEYEGYEQNTYDWNVVHEDGDFTMWEYFDGCEWRNKSCACYKGKAFACGERYGNVMDEYKNARSFLKFKAIVDKE